jgi:hypothetical protein
MRAVPLAILKGYAAAGGFFCSGEVLCFIGLVDIVLSFDVKSGTLVGNVLKRSVHSHARKRKPLMMLRMLKFPLLLVTLFAFQAAFAQSQTGITMRAEPYSRPYTITPDGKYLAAQQDGVVVQACSDNPQTVAFAVEVQYRLEGAASYARADIVLWPNSSTCGTTVLWVGKTADAKMAVWEVTSLGRRQDSTSNN